jgi:hemerythrin-like metal-binding protein
VACLQYFTIIIDIQSTSPEKHLKNNVYSYGRTQQQLLSLTNLINWGNHFSVGHLGIDAQHKQIFDLGLSVYENWRDGRGIDMLHPKVEKLAGLLEAHFLYEEGILREIGYEDLDEHMDEHHGMLKEMETLKETVNERLLLLEEGRMSRGGSMLAPAWPVMQFFMGFSIWHVNISDMRYYEVLTASRSPR